ncbi:radical SAM protein [Streptomyces sp. NPDC004838]
MSGLLSRVSDAYPYEPIQFHDSWLAVDPVIGCKASCSYCLLRIPGWTGVRPETVTPVEDIVERLRTHKYFEPHVTRLCFGTRTDVLLPEVQPYALDFLRALDAKGFRNAVALITKLEAPDDFLAAIRALRHIRVVFLVSWSALPPGVEKGVRRGAAVATIRKLSARGIPVIHYFRPLVPANSDDGTFHRVLSEVAGRALCTVHIGLKLNPRLRDFYAADPVLHPATLDTDEADYGVWSPEGAVGRLRAMAAEHFPDHPLYDRTSCAMARALGEADYTATLNHEESCLASRCPEGQRRACVRSRRVPGVREVEERLRGIGLTNRVVVEDGAIHIDGEIGQQDYPYLLHAFSVPIFADVRFFRVFRGDIYPPGR